MKSPRILTSWAFLQVWTPDGPRQAPILAGIDELGLNRTSTPLTTFDPKNGVGVTASGREYRLVGSEDPIAALRVFGGLWMLRDGQEIRRVAPKDVVAVIEAAPSAGTKSTDQRAEGDLFKIRGYAVQIDRLARLAAVGDADLAAMMGITRREFADLRAGTVPPRLSVDRVEQVLAHVNDRLQGRTLGFHTPDADVRATRIRRMADAGRRMEKRMEAVRRHRIERAAIALPYLRLTDPGMDAVECAQALGVTPDELREILNEVPDDDDTYTVPAPRRRH